MSSSRSDGENEHWCVGKFWFTAQLFEELDSVHAWHVEIEQDQARTVERVGVWGSAELSQRLLSIERMVNRIRQFGPRHTACDVLDVDIIVLNDEDVHQRGHEN